MTEPLRGQTTHKFVVVLNKKIPPAAALNACAHMVATLVARADGEARRHMSFVDYTDADGNAHPVSALSLVVLSAKNSSQLRTVRLDAIRAGLSHVDFTETMTHVRGTDGSHAGHPGRGSRLLGAVRVRSQAGC